MDDPSTTSTVRKYRTGYAVAVFLGACSGWLVTSLWFILRYGPDPGRGFTDTVVGDDGSISFAPMMVPFFVLSVAGATGILACCRIWRSIAGRLFGPLQQEQEGSRK